MKKVLIFLMTVVVCTAISSQAAAQEYLSFPVNNPSRVSLFAELPITKKDVVMLGNSITHGGMWEELFDNKRVKNRGISADKTYDVLRRLDPIVSGQPRKVFILIGTNDLPGGYEPQPEKVVGRIREIVDRFRTESPRTKIYIQSVMPVNDNFKQFATRHASKGAEILEVNAGLKAMCDELGLTYIDLFPALADSEGKLKAELTYDGLHLLGSGYIVWRDVLKPYIK